MNNNIFENSKINKRSHRRFNNLLHRLLHSKFRQISNDIYSPTNDYLERIIEEYRRLINICEPSEAQQRQLEQILELAVYDTVLSESIDRVEKEIAIELEIVGAIKSKNFNLNDKNQASDLEENAYLNNSDKIVVLPLPKVPHQPKKTCVGRPRISISSAVLGVTVALLGLYVFNPCSLFATKENNQIDPRSSVDSKPVQKSINKVSEHHLLGIYNGFSHQAVNFNNTKNNISSPELGLSTKQQIAEDKQICFERKQRIAEHKQRIAETRHSLEEAKQWKDEAQKYLQQAQLYLDVVKNYRDFAHESFQQTQDFDLSSQDDLISTPNPACP
jgi:hypothetical protein